MDVAGHHTGHHHDHAHDSAVSSVSIVSEGTLDLDEVIFFFFSLFGFSCLYMSPCCFYRNPMSSESH